jgi:soluble lytic murein transglycosylase-like protein
VSPSGSCVCKDKPEKSWLSNIPAHPDKQVVRFFLLTLFAVSAFAQTQASLEKQRISVRLQASQAKPLPESSFFTIPFPDPPRVAQVAAITDCEALPDEQLSSLINDAAQREKLEPKLVRALIHQESGGRPCAVSPKGAQGLMQIMPATAETLQIANPFDPKQNVAAGTKFLKQLLTKYSGDVALALGAYNAGSGRVDKDGGVPEIPETKSYVANILAAMQ